MDQIKSMARPQNQRNSTFPLTNRARQKPRRFPLVLRFIKGSIHRDIFASLLVHALWSALVIYIDRTTSLNIRLPSNITSSISIVVGLLLVFRNQSSYYRFWSGQEHLTTVCVSVRNLTRSFLACSYVSNKSEPSSAERNEVEDAVHVLLAFAYATKHTLRFEWSTVAGATLGNLTTELDGDSPGLLKADVAALLPPDMRRSFEHQGLGLPVQLSYAVEGFIKRGHDRGWFHSPQASQLTVQVNQMIAAYSAMETIRLTPLPVAYQIHTKQVLALFGGVLPFGFLASLGWWTILVVSLINFTLYGIEAIAEQLEEPFGYDRNDIKMDGILEDLKVEVDVLLHQWRVRDAMFGRNCKDQGPLI